jgi:hypothetical protein
MSQVIGNQQSRPPGWDVFAPEYANPEQRPGNEPKSQPDQKVGKPRRDHWLDALPGDLKALRSHSAFVPSRITVTESAGRESMAAETIDFGTGTNPILQANACTDRAKVMVSNSR